MAVRDRGSTGWLMFSPSSPTVVVDSSRPACASSLWACVVSFDETDALCRTESYTAVRSKTLWGARGLLTALGRCSIPTLKSHRHSRQSSPTLPKR